MPTRSSRDHDFMAVARRVVEQTIGEKLDGSPLEESVKNPHAVALGNWAALKVGWLELNRYPRKNGRR